MTVRADHPHLLSALREELDVTSTEGRLLAAGPVRLLHRDDRRQGADLVHLRNREGCWAFGDDAGGRRRGGTNEVRRRVRRVRRFAVRVLHSRHRDARDGPGRQKGRRARACRHGTSPRRTSMSLHRLREGARRDRSRCQGQVVRHRRCPAQSAPTEPSTKRPSWRSAIAAMSTTFACPACCTRRCISPSTCVPTSCSIDTSAARSAPGVEAVFTAADIPGAQYVGIIYKDWPIFIGEGQRTSYAGDVLAIVVADTKQHAREAAQARAGRVRRASPDHRSDRRDHRLRDRGVRHQGQRAVDECVSARRRRRGARRRASMSCTKCSTHSASSTHSSNPRARWRFRPTMVDCTCTPAARACGTTAIRSPRFSTYPPIR